MEAQWDEDEMLEEILERRRLDGGSCRQKSCKRYMSWQYMNVMFEDKVEDVRRKEKVKGWSLKR